MTEAELEGHIEKGHMASFEPHVKLTEFLGEAPVLNKLGLIVRTRNNVTNARMILDTKESGVKKITAKTQSVVPPSLFDAVLP